MKNVFKPFLKSVLMSLRLTASASATDAVICKKMFRADMTALIISYEEMNDIMTIIKYPEESGF